MNTKPQSAIPTDLMLNMPSHREKISVIMMSSVCLRWLGTTMFIQVCISTTP